MLGSSLSRFAAWWSLCLIILPLRVVASEGPAGGLAVIVGAEDGEGAVTMAEDGRWLVHVLVTDEAQLAAVREDIDAYVGFVSAGVLGEQLPFVTSSVNRVAIDRALVPVDRISDEECHRILAPHGQFYVRQGGQWTVTIEPEDERYGDWTTFAGNMQVTGISDDTAVAPSTSLRWFANNVVANDMRSINGIVCATGIPREGVRQTPFMIGRDGFSGVPSGAANSEATSAGVTIPVASLPPTTASWCIRVKPIGREEHRIQRCSSIRKRARSSLP